MLGVSNAIRDEMREDLPKFPQQQIQTLYNRINIKQIMENQVSRSEARKHLGIADDQYVFSNVGGEDKLAELMLKIRNYSHPTFLT